MKSISVHISEDDYEEFREASKALGRPIAQLIREAMAHYRAHVLRPRPRLEELPVLLGHRVRKALPTRAELYDDIYAAREGDEP